MNQHNTKRQSSVRPHSSLWDVAVPSILAGSFAGIASTAALHPMDVIRTRLQVNGGRLSQVTAETVNREGVKGLYRGMALPLAAQSLYKATVFAVHNVMLEVVTQQDEAATRTDRFLCGFIAGAFNAALWVTPVEWIRSQLINERHLSYGLVKNLVRQHSSLTLWRGVTWAMARDGIGCGTFFVSMEITKDTLGKDWWYTNAVAGGVAGLSFWVAALPLDTVKTWVQSAPASQTNLSVTKLMKNTYSTEGPFAMVSQLFRGWQVAYGRGIPSAAITISVYSWVFDSIR